MGKKSRQRMAQNGEEKKPNWLAQKWQNMKSGVNDKVQDSLDKAQAEAMKKEIPRWMELSGCNHPNLIHWDDPQISLEYKLLDIRNLKLVRKGKNRDQFLELLTPEERDLYLNFVGYGGKRYIDVEDGNLLIELIKGIRESWKQKRGKGDISPEEEQALNDALDGLIED